MMSYLFHVKRPARYLGNEIHATKNPSPGDLRVGLAFPDLYEIGMSNLGLGILYAILNRTPGIFAERVFAPDLDLEAILRDKGIPLSTLETHTPLGNLDILGFSLQYELSYTNVLTILELGGIPLHSSERTSKDPLVIGGGPCAFNPEPVTGFIDAFVIGEAEYRLPELCLLYREWKASGSSRDELLRSLDGMEGVYVPSLFALQRSVPGGCERLIHLRSRKDPIRKCIVQDLDSAPFPESPLIPFLRIVHDRINMEVARGCPHGCRFCQAGVIYRPVRERNPQTIFDSIVQSLQRTGYEEVSLLSLSIGDYSALSFLVRRLMNRLSKKRIALSLPSIRVGSLDPGIMDEILRVRKTGLTFAPEAASERLQAVINKKMHTDELLQVAQTMIRAGWRAVKFYFMIGLPTETEQDVEEIIRMARDVEHAAHRYGDGFQITVNASTFVPKAHTPFQWLSQISRTEADEKQAFLRERLRRMPYFRFKWHDPRLSVLEGVFARGDRHLGTLLEEAYRLGCRLDGWGEYLRFDAWQRAFERSGIDPDHYLRGPGSTHDPLPWDWIDCGVKKEFLLQEYHKALQGLSTPHRCDGNCNECGICIPWNPGKSKAEVGDTCQHPAESAPSVSISPSPEGKRIRFRYSKRPPAIFLGHLETMAVFQRAFRRTELPLTYTTGHHPHPRMSFSQALALGIESLCEYLDVWVDRDLEPGPAAQRLNAELPEGFQVLDAYTVPLQVSSLEEGVEEVHYRVMFSEAQEKEKLVNMLSRNVEAFRSGSISIARISKRERHTFMDLRPFVKVLALTEESPLHLHIVLCRSNRSLISISRLLEALVPPECMDTWPYSIHKVHMKFRT